MNKFQGDVRIMDDKNRNPSLKLADLEQKQAKNVEKVRFPPLPLTMAAMKTPPKAVAAAAQLTVKMSQKEAQLKALELENVGFDDRAKTQELKLGEIEGKTASADSRLKLLEANINTQVQHRE